ncbi:MAG: extracellular solute-binding protein [Firmicutes bacterium]|nr:extracellular solute-binding protein [Bacillota bacterium]
MKKRFITILLSLVLAMSVFSFVACVDRRTDVPLTPVEFDDTAIIEVFETAGWTMGNQLQQDGLLITADNTTGGMLRFFVARSNSLAEARLAYWQEKIQELPGVDHVFISGFLVWYGTIDALSIINSIELPRPGRPLPEPRDPRLAVPIDFWGWGDPDEVEVFRPLVEQFNEMYRGHIRVNYRQINSNVYVGQAFLGLQSARPPDVVYVGDGDIKHWASLGLLLELDDFFDESPYLDPRDIWPSALDRYRINTTTMEAGGDNPLFAVPKDIGPSVIYYNIDAFEAVGVRIISVDAESIAAFNAGAPDLTGRTRTEIGIPAGVAIAARGFDPEHRIFNNRIAMDWDERDVLAKLLTSEHGHNPQSPTRFGYFTEWWFAYGWSVGGDVIRFDEESGNWRFTLGCTHHMWLATDGTFHRYEADAGEGAIEMRYSQRQAFERFVSLTKAPGTQVGSMQGLGITPLSEFEGVSSGLFTRQDVAMFVGIRAATVPIRRLANFRWDVAPLPVAPGGGIESGHSGSMGFGISARTTVPEAAFLFTEFLAGRLGQAAQAESGFNIPNQISLANSDVFLQPDQHPRNSSIFLRAAMVQGPGDWWYLQDNAWINQWAPILNGEVRNNQRTIESFFDLVTDRTNTALERYT